MPQLTPHSHVDGSYGKQVQLTDKETREILTPFAFKIDESLLGLPIASPWRRGLALLIDFAFIAMLTSIPGELLAIFIAITFYRLGNKKRSVQLGKIKGYKRRVIIRTFSALVIFIILVDTLPALRDKFSSSANNNSTELIVAADLKQEKNTAIAIADIMVHVFTLATESECRIVMCWQGVLTPVVKKIVKLPLVDDEAVDALNGITQATDLNQPDKKTLHKLLIVQYQKLKAQDIDSKYFDGNALKQKIIKESQFEKLPKTNLPFKVNSNEQSEPITDNAETESGQKNKVVYSLIEWGKGIINDLGLGFGWAAFYFSVLTSWLKGQTLGKKILHIKVIQLDGTPLSLWDSFGRYGGYAAGLATGLLGFLQIFWEPNRQAIHDKISATIVIDLNKIQKPAK